LVYKERPGLAKLKKKLNFLAARNPQFALQGCQGVYFKYYYFLSRVLAVMAMKWGFE
jgi:hypothetical protein